MQASKKYFGLSIVTLLGIILIYLPLILSQDIFDPDRAYIIDPLKDIASVKGYSAQSLYRLDVQPIRDLYFKCVLSLSKVLNFDLFILFNLFIWISCLLLALSIIQIKILSATGLLFLAGLSLHPIAVWSISWPSASKHLLSTLFITLALYFWHRRSFFYIYLFYLISILTQPLYILFPIIYLIINGKKSFQKEKYLISLMLLAMIVIGSLNFYYYDVVYPLQTGVGKTHAYNEFSLASNLLGIFRSIFQIFLPINLSLYYSPQNILNLGGFPFILIIVFYYFKKYKFKFYNYQFLLFLFPLATIYLRPTNIFVSDTYLLLPLLFLIGLLKEVIEESKKGLFLVGVGVYFLFIFVLGIHNIYSINTTEGKLRLSYERDSNCKNSMTLASYYMTEAQIEKFKKIGQDVMQNRCIINGANGLEVTTNIYALILFLNKEIPQKGKLKSITGLSKQTPLSNKIRQKLNEKIDSPSDKPPAGLEKIFEFIENF